MHLQDSSLFSAPLSGGRRATSFGTQLFLPALEGGKRARRAHCGNTRIMNQEENNKRSEVIWRLSVFSIIATNGSKVKIPGWRTLSTFSLFAIQYKAPAPLHTPPNTMLWQSVVYNNMLALCLHEWACFQHEITKTSTLKAAALSSRAAL